ncbi:hypothetical protein BKA70DRAFT_1419016 [Coprinopsis sp. MPI-PUGE-AT-0042]|nr:hypothetical protein BKA70DRAFT_1419016 [Coprinopsis sp. MPI-PUGE-AT-0042]
MDNNTSQTAQPNSNELLAAGNKQYSQKQFSEAAETYTSIIKSNTDPPVPRAVLRNTYSNRGACYMAQGAYEQAINDYLYILTHLAYQTGDDPKVLKRVHLRLREAYEKQGVAPDKATRPIEFRVNVFTGPGASTRNEGRMNFQKEVRVGLCGKRPQQITPQEAQEIVTLAKAWAQEHYQEVLDAKPGLACTVCNLKSTTMLHIPDSHLWNESDVHIVDYALPVCVDNTPCAAEARRMMSDNIRMMYEFGLVPGWTS